MTTEVLYTSTPKSSNNGKVALIHGKGGEQFRKSEHSRVTLPVDDDAVPNPQRITTMVRDGRRISGGSESSEKGSPKTVRSPRCEAFVMTGEKMLSLNPKISPCYAKMCQNQLPPTVEVDSSLRDQRTANLFDDFPSMHHRSGERQRLKEISPVFVSGSHSEHVLDIVTEKSEIGAFDSGCDDQPSNNGGTAIEQQLLLKDSDRTMALDGKESACIGNIPSTTHRQPMLASHVSQASQSTPVTPSRGSQTDIRQKHCAALMANEMETEIIDGGQNGNDPCYSQQQKLREKTLFASSKIGSSMGTRSSDVLLALSNSQQSVAYPLETIARMAKHLFTHHDGFRGIKISSFLVKRDKLSKRIAHEFLALFNFAGLRIDVALRSFLAHVQLCGDTFEREKLLEHFAERYFECNPTVFSSADDAQLLASALLLLSADLHGKVCDPTRKAMSCREFIDNMTHLEHNKYSHAMLRELFVAVSEQPFNCQAGSDETEESVQSTSTDRKHERRFSRVLSSKRRGSSATSELRTGGSLAGTAVDPEQQVDYKHGWLLRKSIYDADGKRTPLGRRKWQMHYATVRGMVLYLHQNEHSFSSAGRYVTFRNCILLHHALAEHCRDYKKRRNVFHLRTAQLGESLFQTSEPAEVQRWCDAINYVAAAFSTPALPAPVGATGLVSFYKPHLPSTATHLSIPDQLRAHEQRMEETALNLARLREEAPPMKARGRVVHEYFYKERFLEIEKSRYSVYVSILREKLSRACSAIRCGDSFSSNAMFLSGKGAVRNGGNSSNFEETNREGRPCSSVASQCDVANNKQLKQPTSNFGAIGNRNTFITQSSLQRLHEET
uniref:SEC7 domain-containing protein n=1 Tax=Globodera pallida TaxID=36090 RepID=A0A183CIS3_GLOPA